MRFFEKNKKSANREVDIREMTSGPRREMLDTAFKYVRDETVSGDYHEFGVARGLTSSGRSATRSS
jgi:hypothetical protein